MKRSEGFATRKSSVPRIDISPLIDVVFLMLLFYVVTTTFVERPGIKLELPDAASAAVTRTEDVEVSVAASGGIFVGGKRVETSDLLDALKADLSTTKSTTVVIRADRQVTHGIVVEVMDAARKAGAKELVVATREGGAGN